jgi:PTH1 family peptidyl-tRNA hydrolase
VQPFFRLIAGLGNPGPRYAATRHNVGFMIVEQLAEKLGTRFRNSSKFNCALATADKTLLCKPMTYMNRSGGAIAALCRYHEIYPNQVLIIIDDAALPLGKLRLRVTGSGGGHNGLQSVLDHLETFEVPRLRFGIGAAEGAPMTDHVLSEFAAEEKPLLRQEIARAVDAIEMAQRDGPIAAMNIFNS